ncbi:MAG: primase [Verrucomicrobiales bacterium]|nr:primase [Verrucomicrobiales bacterium]
MNVDKGRLAVLRSMGENLRKTENNVLLDKYAQKTALRLGVSAESVRSEFKKFSGPEKSDNETFSEQEQEQEQLPKPPPTELWLLKSILQTDDFIEWTMAHLELDWLSDENVRHILEYRFEAQANESWRGLATWLSELENIQLRSLITEILTDERPVAELGKVLQGEVGKKGIVQLLRDKSVDRQLSAINERLANPDLDAETTLEFTQQKIALRQLKQSPLMPKGE